MIWKRRLLLKQNYLQKSRWSYWSEIELWSFWTPKLRCSHAHTVPIICMSWKPAITLTAFMSCVSHNSSNSFLALPGMRVSHEQLADLASTKLLPMDIPTSKGILSSIALSLYRTELPFDKGTLTRIICYFIRASNPGTMKKMWSSKYLLH